MRKQDSSSHGIRQPVHSIARPSTKIQKLGMQIRSEFNLNSPNSLRIQSQREFAANSA